MNVVSLVPIGDCIKIMESIETHKVWYILCGQEQHNIQKEYRGIDQDDYFAFLLTLYIGPKTDSEIFVHAWQIVG